MSPENQQKLYTDFPLLFREAIAGERKHFGIECGDGWFNIVYELCTDIEHEAHQLGISTKSQEWPEVLQVKEKFGTLSFYCAAGERDSDGRGMLPSIWTLIAQAAKKSKTVCEVCGSQATLHDDGYMRTLCDNCYAARACLKQSGAD